MKKVIQNNKFSQVLLMAVLFNTSFAFGQNELIKIIYPVDLRNVQINDAFWSPKLKIWDRKTVYDVFDKLEGKYEPDRKDLIEEKNKNGHTRNTFVNFDKVAQGQKDTKEFVGLPWFDGLIYESIRGAADLLIEYPDSMLEKRIDAYIDRIAAAQAADPDGYLNTYTTLTRSNQRWGTNGGDDVWQHDLYNSGMMVEAGIHYYYATGKIKLLAVATKQSNYLYDKIGPAPKLNMIPGHGGPEEAMIKLYWFYRKNPLVKNSINVPVHESNYYDLANYWIEARGNYGERDGTHARKNFGSYDQDHISVFEQKTIEGHAVRATLLATGVTASALESKDPRYIATANNYWNNMIGKRMFITGGEGAVAKEEKFGPDYFLPDTAYLETCAAIGAGFFSERMHELQADGKYMDEFERIIYNNMLSGISLGGDKYFYENPLGATDHKRWAWHDCPCCPPMFLKMVGELPSHIYSFDDAGIYVNLFIGSEAKFKINKTENVEIIQETQYPWKGKTTIKINPAVAHEFSVRVRIPGWAMGKENPYNLYVSNLKNRPSLFINGEKYKVNPVNGYISIVRKWKKGDKIELNLPVEPRFVLPNDSIITLKNKLAIEAGPIVYCLEGEDNSDLMNYTISQSTAMEMFYHPTLLNGINVIQGNAILPLSKKTRFMAIPYYAVANRKASPYKVWLSKK